jgi:starch-binding outer membrane protein, SusD/RagB family
MNQLKYILILLVSLCGASSCKKEFLDPADNFQILRQEYVKDLKTVGQYMNGVYIDLSTSMGNQLLVYPELIADNIKPTGSTLSIHYNWSQNPEDDAASMNAYWRSLYNLIRSCSFVLEKTEEYKEQNTAQANEIKAQAYGLRALANYYLINMFSQSYVFTNDASHLGIPYVTTSDWTVEVSGRAKVSEVYTGIISDLKTALDLFGAPVSTLYFNRNAAKALLARVYLFKGDYQSAKDLAKDVADNVPLLTIANGYPNNLYKNLAPAQTESIFQLSPSKTGVTLPSAAGTYTGTYNTSFQGAQFRGATTLYFATKDITDLLKQSTNDVRKNWINSGGAGKDSIRKYPINIIAGFGTSATDITNQAKSYYETILRSSEMFLTVAEAAAKTGDENTARTYLNAIRQRANTSLPAIAPAGAALLDSIYVERRKELAFEGIRMFDLQRWKKGVSRLDALTPAAQNLPYPNDKAIAPIPGPDVDLLSLTQNTGYF